MQALENKIGYSFRDRQLLRTALTHSSYTNENHLPKQACYERLEFLGDSILGFCAADKLFSYKPELPEGKMTRIRADLVCEKSLYAVAQKLDLGRYMLLGKGEEKNGGREKPSILADMVEAVTAAIYVDSDLEHALAFLRTFVLPEVLNIAAEINEDYKTMLQEKIQQNPDNHIEYTMLSESGPDHNKTFVFAVSLNGVQVGWGSGRSKKDAEQMAAKQALETFAE